MTESTTGVAASNPTPNVAWDAEYAAWQKAVAGVLAKGRRVDISEIPADAAALLAQTTYDGATIAPLYTPADEQAESALPGRFPFVRGRDGNRDVTVGWHVTARFGQRDASPAVVNEAILDALASGVSALWLAITPGTVSPGALTPADLPAVLREVLLDLAPVTLDAGTEVAAAAESLYAILEATVVADRAAVRIGLGAAPLTESFRGQTPAVDAAALAALALAAAQRTESVRAITVDGTAFHERGAADAEELGAAIAAGVQYVRDLVAAGLSAEDALGQIEFRLAATDDQFQTIAKFRAGRQLWARVAQVLGHAEAGAAPQHAVTSSAMMTQRDPWVNMLRTTLAAFGAGVGGADSVTVLPFDAALPAGALGTSAAFAQRIARNTQLLLLEESHLGRVLDPAGGSWYVESLTGDLAAIGWKFFQEIEAAGGYTAALATGIIANRVEETGQRRYSDIAHRVSALTGINEFPNLAETAPDADSAPRLADVRRYAAAFEGLRDRSDAHLAATGSRPRVALVALGPLSEYNVRTSFASNLLASGGIEAVSTGTVAADDIAAALTKLADANTVVVVCGTDRRYGTEAVAAVAAIRAAGASQVLLAGPEKAFPGEGDTRPDGFLTMKIDAVETLTGLLDTLGVN
ncbi:methylmalonyl-CoA mutase small subunit [Tomitella biformata]|uniref:methylmalonyl-CoA mutase small subunit n=1 Tax=Tomitella biformata TaxID=630403 RepID=UPI0004B5A9FA|nr:methylmalonyl-CoA mutase small subunit [Tomitella biformata]